MQIVGVIIGALVLVLGGYYAWIAFFSYDPVDTGNYSLATVEQNPIPQRELFALWNAVALKLCADTTSFGNVTPERCREVIMERHRRCAASAGHTSPPVIAEVKLARQLGRTYMHCVVPRPTCNGVEIRNEEEARRHCR